MAVATYQDVATSLGRTLTTDEQGRVTWWLEGAEMQIRARLGDVALLDQNTVRYVEAEAVAGRMSNPDGYQSETVDDYTYRYGSETRRVIITDDLWRMLDPTTGSGAFSARPYFEPDDLPPVIW